MSGEESKISDSDYVVLGEGKTRGNTVKIPDGLDDPNLSQEDRDLRLAIALQQQENAAVYDAHKKKHDAAVKAQTNRTARSGVHTRLAAVRDKDHGMLSVPSDQSANVYVKDTDYLPPGSDINMGSLKGSLPQEVADRKLALQLQKVEQAGAGTAQNMTKIIKEEAEDDEAQALRTNRTSHMRGFA